MLITRIITIIIKENNMKGLTQILMESWKVIQGYPDYEVSSHGRVRSNRGRSVDKILRGIIDGNGYLRVNLKSLDGKIKAKMIHQLVATEFLNHNACGHDVVVNHKDNDPLNNNIDNLELVSNQENSRQHKTSVGVSWHSELNKWRVQCHYPKSKNYELGYYSDKFQAQQVSDLAYDLILDGLTEKEWVNYLNQDGVTSRKRKLQ